MIQSIRTICAIATLSLLSTAAVAQTNSKTVPTETGTKEIHWGMPAARDYGPPPAFSTLDSNGDGSISADEADGYALLANDFLYADSNRDGRISKSEYARWISSHK
ncbi:MAG: EF-hand domain-containing protein [Dokdonella sp.]